MQFGINWNDGYEVTVLMVGEHGYLRHFPLRNFGEHQGDARIFKEVDCPKLTDAQIRMLIKHYDPKVKYKRISGTMFVREKVTDQERSQ